MDESLSLQGILLELLKEQLRTNEKISALTVQLLSSMGEAIKTDTKRMQDAVEHIDYVMKELGIQTNVRQEVIKQAEQPAMAADHSKDYPAAFFLRNTNPLIDEGNSYYLFVDHTDDGIAFRIFNQNWEQYKDGLLINHTLSLEEAVEAVLEQEPFKEYPRYTMEASVVGEKIQRILHEPEEVEEIHMEPNKECEENQPPEQAHNETDVKRNTGRRM
ncbi:MAG: hypothetical protein Q4B26_04165 [Eubacteriales bacterium]|nr:hypothetical protein [Eubacteriales bacterium]